MAIQVGSRVRSFDFENRDLAGVHACYIEGTVVAVGLFDEFKRDFRRYKIQVEREVFGGEEFWDFQPGESFVYPPVNGTARMMGGLTDGVVEIVEELAAV